MDRSIPNHGQNHQHRLDMSQTWVPNYQNKENVQNIGVQQNSSFTGMKPLTGQNHKAKKKSVTPMKTGRWSESEDGALKLCVEELGKVSWSKIADKIPGRNGKQCRERWVNALDPNINRGPWTEEEDDIIIKNHAKYGNAWSKIGKLLPGRPNNKIKNRWNSALKKKYQSMHTFPTDKTNTTVANPQTETTTYQNEQPLPLEELKLSWTPYTKYRNLPQNQKYNAKLSSRISFTTVKIENMKPFPSDVQSPLPSYPPMHIVQPLPTHSDQPLMPISDQQFNFPEVPVINNVGLPLSNNDMMDTGFNIGDFDLGMSELVCDEEMDFSIFSADFFSD
eukprot:TRINITY_DN9951_c0_g1_i1.p1 TRINITY_DN9951_c0_g1~~TRINITY_DN9951_c0_g1_i1.p1  ORF type:complete len:335 (-),score=73.85 TRINITY_DN9951_c0_g1_i1:25-1029(-)